MQTDFFPYVIEDKLLFNKGCLMSSCLIVIDVQESFRHRPYFTATDLPAYLAA